MPVFNVSLDVSGLKAGVTEANRSLNNLAATADKTAQSVNGLFQDKKGRWHNASGRFATEAERAAAGVRNVGTQAKAAAGNVAVLGKSLAEAGGNMLSLTAKIGALVGAYKALDTAKGFVQRGIEYASSLEDAQTSIASIIMATNKVSTAQGKTLQGAEAFNASLEISKNLMDEMQVLALESTATFDSLVKGVSGIIAPATKAGVSLEKLPRFAVTAAQAMSTMKIPIEQMRTEIEALLSGNINKVQDILATNLGITGEMVRNWKEQGTLVQELEKRLMAFALAGERVVNSWSGLKSNMADALDYLSKVTGEGIFENVKQSYRELLQFILNTDTGKPGISAEFENVAGLIRDIQDAIGEGILDLTRDLIDNLKELNKPENIAEVKRSFSEFKDSLDDILTILGKVGGALSYIITSAMNAWNNMPQIVQDMGLVGAIAFGKKGIAIVTGIGFAADQIAKFTEWAGANEGLGGADAYKEYWAKRNADRSARGPIGDFTLNLDGTITDNKKPQKPTGPYTTTPAIPPDNTRKPAGTIENARQKIEELRREIEVLNGESSKAGVNLANKLDDIAKAGKAAGLSVAEIGALQQEYKDAFQAKTLKDFNKELLQAQGNTSALKEIQIGETLRDWQQQFQAVGMSAEQYGPKIEALKSALEKQQEYKDLKVVADFYKEMAELSGDYGKSVAYQNKLIEQQAELWAAAGIPLADIQERVELMRLDLSVDPFDGAYRGLLKFSAEYADSGKQWENITYSFARDFNDATRDMFDTFLDTGRVSFASLEQSFYQLLKNMAYQALVQPVVLSIVGGVQQGVYGMTTAGRTGSGMGLNSLTGLPVSSILPESVTSGISGITGTVLPGTHVAGLMGPTTSGAALSGGLTIGSALGYGAFGGLGYSLLGGALGLPQNSYTGVTSSLGGALGAWGGAALGSTGALAGSIIGSALPFVGTALGALAGGLIGGLFGGGGDKDPWVNISSWVDLLGTIDQKDPYQARSYRTSGTGYEITANQGEGISWETGKQLADMAAGLSQEAIKSVATFRESVASIGNEALTQQFETALEQNRFLKHWYEFEDREVKPEELMEDFQRAVQEKLYLSLTEVDLSTLTTAADGAIADTVPEIAKAITDSVNFVALGANLGEYQDDFNAAISGKLLDALNQIDTSGIALDVDKSSLAGWEAAAKALQAWDEVDTALTAILDPASELETTMSAAQGQFDGWLATLRKLGWQEEAVAGIEAKRASVLQSYASSLTRAVEEDLALRSLALRYGSDSGEYGLRSLQYRQQTELDELRKKLGEDSDLYQTMVQTQQAETTKYRIDLLEKELEDALAAEEQSRTRQASAMLSAAKSAEKLRDSMKKIAESFADARRDIWNSPADDLPGSSYLSSLASFDDAYLKALKGDEDALSDLPNLASGLLELGRENLATSEEYSDLFYDVDRKLKHVQESAQNGLIKGQSAQIDAITSQTGTLQAAINAGTAAGEYTGRSVDAIRAELESLQNLLAQQTAAITSAGSTTRREDLLQAKVEQLNQSGYQGRHDWTITSVQNEMAAQNLTVEDWYDKYGKNENLGVEYDTAAARRDLLQRKADAMNAGRTLAGGQEAGGWTADKVEAAIKAEGMTVDEWYLRFGRAEGFASGGITPVGRPFWVGERGPELMMGGSPHRVLSHTDSMALVERGRGGWDMTALIENGRGVLRELRSLNSRIARLEKYTRDTSDAVTRASVLGWTVTQEATA